METRDRLHFLFSVFVLKYIQISVMQNAYLYFSLSGLVIALVSAILGAIVLFRNPKNKMNQTFALFCLTIFVWAAAYIFWPLAKTAEGTLLAFQVLHLGACFIPIAYFHYVVRWLDIYKQKRVIVILGYITATAISFTIPSKFFIAKMAPKFEMAFWADPGPLYYSYLILFFGYFIYSSALLYQGYRRETGVKRHQIKLILTGIVIGFFGGSSNYFLWFNIDIPPYGNILTVAFVIFTAYAIMRYRFMDMRVVARAMSIYFLDALFISIFFSLILLVCPHVAKLEFSQYIWYLAFIVAPLFAVFFVQYHKWMTTLIDRHFFYSLYDYQTTIASLSAELTHYSDLNKILDLIVDKIMSTMGLNRAGVLLVDTGQGEIRYKIAKVTGFDITNGISLVKDNFLTRYLKKIAKPLVREELSGLASNSQNPKEARAFLNLEKEMEHIEASLCLPLLSGQILRGIIVLGFKKNDDPYTQQDLDLLSTLSNQAAIAIDNARMYQETKNFNKVLQVKVNEQTKDIKAKAEHLEKLLKMREEFLDIASHQLKTPVSVIRGTLSMFREGSMDNLPKAEQRKFMDNIYHKAEKLNVIISDILRASEIDSEEFKIDPVKSQSVSVVDTVKEVYNDLKELADEKGIKLLINLPKRGAFNVLSSADFLEQAIYNLVDNAIKYTSKGSVTIDLSGDDKEITLIVKDTGIGVPEGEKAKIFDKFARAKNAVNMYTDGSGLGLYIVKKIIEAHDGGSITLLSKENEGSTFTVKLRAISAKQAANAASVKTNAAIKSGAILKVAAAKGGSLRTAAAKLAKGLKKSAKSGKIVKDKSK